VNPIWSSLGGLPSKYAGPQPTAAVLIPLYEHAGEVRVVIIKRPDHMNSHPGQLAFPGGRIDPDDEGPVAAALREAHEEVAIEAAEVEPIGFLDPVHTNRLDVVIAPLVARLVAKPDLVPHAGEVEKVLEPPLSLFFDEDAWHSEDWDGRTLWFIEVEGETFWGASARMMRSLLAALR
jgi:8-oxo-dGTP pyrophosphatase MutT (NUDIX family)